MWLEGIPHAFPQKRAPGHISRGLNAPTVFDSEKDWFEERKTPPVGDRVVLVRPAFTGLFEGDDSHLIMLMSVPHHPFLLEEMGVQLLAFFVRGCVRSSLVLHF